MPHKFIEGKAYVKASTKDTGGQDLSISLIDDVVLRKNGVYGILLIDWDLEQYTKSLSESVLSLIPHITNSMSMNEGDKPGEHKNGMSLEKVLLMKNLGMFLGYLVNSSTWEDDKTNEYDQLELQRRWERIIESIRSLP